MAIEPRPPAPASPNQYLPALPPKPLIFEKFNGMFTQTSRPGVPDDQAAWFDGFMPIGERFLRTLYGRGTALYTGSGGRLVAFFEFVNIAAVPYMIVVLNDGSIDAVNTNTSAATTIAVAGTITNPSRSSVGITQYGSLYALIVAQQTNGYFLWNGTTFYKPGDAIPGGGHNMPTGLGGSAIEVYQGRIWIANNAVITFSAPGSFWDFTSGSGGGTFTSTDSFLRVRFIQLRQTNGFLYLIADSSVNYISGVQTSGSPPVTTFTNQNADPEVGSPWASTVVVFNRNILLANAFGVHVSYGAAVTKISDALDGVYSTVSNFGSFVPSAAKAIIFSKKVFMLLLPIVDPITGVQVNKLLMWDGKRWFASEQDVSLTYIQFQEINSVLTAYGTDSQNVYPLFAQPSNAFTKRAQSKLWDEPGGYQFTKAISRLWAMFKFYSAVSPSLRISIDNEISSIEQEFTLGPLDAEWSTTNGSTAIWHTTLNLPAAWTTSGQGIVVLDPEGVAQNGVVLGMTLETEAADMAVITMMIQPEIADYRG